MKNYKILFLALLFGYFLQINSQNLIKPLDSCDLLSGGFAELRDRHFHSGIDYKTAGAIGKNVYCIEKGYVSRISVSATGYGKVVYIAHPNGITSVYAHLDNFSDKIDSIIRKEQYSKKNFSVNIFPPKHQIIINQGEILGQSGNSGSSGGPHLHFELRDTKSEKPLNPFLYGYGVQDTQNPTIKEICVINIDDNDPYNLNSNINRLDFTSNKKKQTFKIPEGRLGLLVEAFDTKDNTSNTYGIYKMELIVNDCLVYKFQMDKFSFNESKLINLHLLYGYLIEHKKRLQKLYIEPENLLSIYFPLTSTGIINLSASEKAQIKITACDFNENCTTKEFTLKAVKNNSQEEKIEEIFGKNFIFIDKDIQNKIVNGIFESIIPKDALYYSYKFEAKQENDSIFILGDEKVPLKRPILIQFNVENFDENLKDKICIVKLDNNLKVSENLKGSLSADKKTIKAYTSSFGRFSLNIDTIKPNVSIKIPQNRIVKNFLDIQIYDENSAIASFDCYIDEKWVLADYDYKIKRLRINLNKELKNKGKHSIKAIIKDNRNNIEIKESGFIYQ